LIVRFIRSTWPPLGKSVHWTGFLTDGAPWVVGFGQAVLDAASHGSRTVGEPWLALADHVEAHWPGIDTVPVPRLFCELDPARHWARTNGALNGSLGEDRVDLAGHSFEHVLQELPSRFLSAVATSWATANLDVRSIPTKRKSFPSAVCSSAMSI
jgi:hypothetical protein